jgi:4'-phosphopantetheinyl transferase EntD
MGAPETYATHAIALATADELGTPMESAVDADHGASRLAARRAVRALVGPDATVVVVRRPGRPPLACVGEDRPVALSLAHRDGRGVAIAARETVGRQRCRVGIDLERFDAVASEHERYFLTAREQRAAATLTPTLLWVIKEAVWKALSLGDDVPLTALELDIDPRGALRGIWLRGERRPALATLMTPWPEYLVAAVWVGGER